RVLRWTTPAFVVLLASTWLAVAAAQPQVRVRVSDHWLAFSVIAIVLLASAIAAVRSVSGNSDHKPFAFGLLQCALAAVAAWLVVYPDAVPFRVSLWTAASASPTQIFLLAGATMVTPLILLYSAFAYRVFRGKAPVGGYAA